MKFRLILFLLLSISSPPNAFCQNVPTDYKAFIGQADSLLKLKEFSKAAFSYSSAFKTFGNKGKTEDRYNAARAWSMINVYDSAFINLEKIVYKALFTDSTRLANDSDLVPLHKDIRWKQLLDFISEDYNADRKAQSRKTVMPPWHLVDIWYKIEPPKKFESFSIDFEISEDVSNKYYLYIAPIGLGKFNDVKFYGGVQTSTGGYPDKFHIQNNSDKITIGRGIIFSRWDERNPDAIEIAEGGVCESGGYEGDFVSVRNTYQWNKGKYKIALVNIHKHITINNKIHSFVGMKIYSYDNNTSQIAGYLAFPGEEIKLGESLAIFVELFGKPIKMPEIPNCKITFRNITINEIKQEPKTITAYYKRKLPQWANSIWREGQIVVNIGEPFDRKNCAKIGDNYFIKIK